MSRKRITFGLEDIPEILEKAITLINNQIEQFTVKVLTHGEELSAVEGRALVAYTTCLYQTYKDHRATQKEINSGIVTMDDNELRRLATQTFSQNDEDDGN